MKYKEFLSYLESNLPGYEIFMEKALAYQRKKNSGRPAAKRWNEERLNRAAYDMWKQAMEPLYNNLKGEVKSPIPLMWVSYIEKHEVLESVTDSIRELDFSDGAA